MQHLSIASPIYICIVAPLIKKWAADVLTSRHRYLPFRLYLSLYFLSHHNASYIVSTILLSLRKPLLGACHPPSDTRPFLDGPNHNLLTPQPQTEITSYYLGTMMMYSSTLSVLLSIGALSAASASESTATSTNGGLCYASCAIDESGIELCKFTTKVNLYAGELGYYQFEECGDDVNPTLGMEVGKTYQFVQKDRSN